MRKRLARLILPAPREEIDEELAFHLEERVREYVAGGMSEEEARAAARERLGDLNGVRAECAALLSSERRTETRRRWLNASWLDFKLGFRMLVKYPGLTVVGGFAMAFAIWVGAGTFEFVRQVVHPSLPLDDGDRVVGVHVVDAQTTGLERRVAWDLGLWREELESVVQLGAFRTLDRNLITGDGVGEPVEVAEMSASGFDVARVPPHLGRALVAADEAAGAAPVVVLGWDVWQRRFGGDPEVIGRTIRLSATQAEVVGVMPEGFRFPVSQRLWMPLPREALAHEPRSGPPLRVFGRLAPGVSLEEAQAELAALGRRAAAAHPETHEHLRPRVLPYARSILNPPSVATLALVSVNGLMILFVVLICGNVALLMFARAATRQEEILVRGALGASRARITGQLFIEALVLGGFAALVGLAAAGFGLRWLYSAVLSDVFGPNLPFWLEDRLSPATIGYTLLLTVIAAAVAGVLPALKVTGRDLETRLRQASAGGGGIRFGGIWTAVIAGQLAVTVALPMFTWTIRQEMVDIRDLDPGFAAEEYLAVRLEMDREAAAESGLRIGDDVDERALRTQAEGVPDDFRARFAAAARELEQRLESRSDVVGVTYGQRLPLMYHPHRLIEVDEGGAAPKHPQWPSYRISSVVVAPDFFNVLDLPIVSGRGLHSGDLAEDARSVLVNQSFVELVLGGRNAIGRHVQYRYLEGGDTRDAEQEPWYQIVGVVPDAGTSASDFDPKRATVYHPGSAGGIYPAQMAIHTASQPGALVQDLRSLATAVEPGLRLYDSMPLDRLDDAELGFYRFWISVLWILTGVALLLSLASIYSVMSFAVSRRMREIGIRRALGAHQGWIMAAVFRRPAIQVGLGLLGGAVLVLTLAQLTEGNVLSLPVLGAIAAYLLVMVGVCSLACIVPARRVFHVEPTEALRAE